MSSFQIIQGGMGVHVSSWRLASAVSQTGQLGVVSGTGMDRVLARILQDGDPDGHYREALSFFPFPEIAKRILNKYFKPDGRKPGEKYLHVGMVHETTTLAPTQDQADLVVAGNFCEVFLAKQGHFGKIGINFLEKIQDPNHCMSFEGAMIAGVDYVIMGAGIPLYTQAILEKIANGEVAAYPVDIHHTQGGKTEHLVEFDPEKYGMSRLQLQKPKFLAIVSSTTLAKKMCGIKREGDRRLADALIIEGWTAGGHNAPPRVDGIFNDKGEPVYGPKDTVNLQEVAKLGVPFYLAGGYNRPDMVKYAIKVLGASGVQVGSGFALCEESGLDPELRRTLRRNCYLGTQEVFRDGRASPTGFPIGIAQLEGTLSETEAYKARSRICDLGYLRHVLHKGDAKDFVYGRDTFNYACPAEPVKSYIAKGGLLEETVGRKCVCNGLYATIGLAQYRPHAKNEELKLVTFGTDIEDLRDFLQGPDDVPTAERYVRYLLSKLAA